MKKCPKCLITKPFEAFSSDSSKTDGLRYMCKSCTNKCRRARDEEDPVSRKLDKMLGGARTRSYFAGRDFSLTKDQLRELVVDRCPVLGQPLLWNCGDKSGPKPFSPSLDRIDNSKGYVISNVAIISHRANTIKHSASLEEVKSLYEYMLRGCQNNTPDMVLEQ